MTQAASKQSKLVPYAFLAPFLAIFALFVAYPLCQSLLLSLQQTYGPQTSVFVGWRNFRSLATDPLFWQAVRNTFVYASGSLLIQLPLALGLAMLLNRPNMRGRALLRLIFFSPTLVGIAFVAVMFEPIFAKSSGLLNIALNYFFGFNKEYGWLDQHVMAALIVASLWMYVGFNMVFFLAALQNVDRELVDAARIDGAGPWSVFRHVTIPAIRPVASFVVLLSLIGSFQLFELPYVMLRFSAGPENRGLTIVMYLYQVGFESGDLGYASAIGWCLGILLVVVAIVQRVILKRYEE